MASRTPTRSWRRGFRHGFWGAVRALAGDLTPPSLTTMDLPQGWVGRERTPAGLAELGELVRSVHGQAADAPDEAWTDLREQLLAADAIGSGARYVALNLDPAAMGEFPAYLTIWEYLTPYATPEEEVEAFAEDMRTAGDVTTFVRTIGAATVGGVAGRLRDDKDAFAVFRFIRQGELAHQVAGMGPWTQRDSLEAACEAPVRALTRGEPTPAG